MELERQEHNMQMQGARYGRPKGLEPAGGGGGGFGDKGPHILLAGI